MINYISIGPIKIYYYSICILLGIIIAYNIINSEGKRLGYPKDYFLNLVFWALIFGIIGARIYYVLFNLDYYLKNPLEIIMIWHGGLAIHGGIIAGLIFILIYANKYKQNVLRILDIIVPGLIIGQAIGRWGNFFNQEAHGPATTLAHLQNLHIPEFIIKGMHINGVYYEPTFFYESVWCLIGFIVLLIYRRMHYTKIGQTTGLYLIWYGLGRFFIEHLRTDSLLLFNIKVAQLVSIIMIIVGIIIMIKEGKGSKFERLYNDKENIDEVKF